MARSFKLTPMHGGTTRASDRVLKDRSHHLIRVDVRKTMKKINDRGESLVLREECQFVCVEQDFGGKRGKHLLKPDVAVPYVIRPRTTANRLILVANCERDSYDFADLRTIRK